MTRRKRVGVSVVCLLVVAPVGVWVATRRSPPIEFLGDATKVKFIYLDEKVDGISIVDFTLPGGYRVVYPKKTGIDTQDTDPSTIAGFLEWQGSGDTQDARFRVKYPPPEEIYSMPVFWGGPKGSEPKMGHRGPFYATGYIWGIPFATDERYRDVVFEWWNWSENLWKVGIRLPVTHRFGPPVRNTTTFKAGKWTVTAKPRPWKLTTEDLALDVTSNSPDEALLLYLSWRDPHGGPPDFMSPHVIEANESIVLRLSGFRRTGLFEGRLAEAKRIRMKVKVRTANYDTKLYRENGQLLFTTDYMFNFKNPSNLRHQGIDLLACRGMRATDADNSWRVEYGSNTFDQIKDGETVEAIGYRIIREYPISGQFDTMPGPVK